MSVSVSKQSADLASRLVAEVAVAHVKLGRMRPWREVLRGEGAEAAGQREAASAEDPGPVWLELYLELDDVAPEIEERIYDWFEGSIQPWDELDRPLVGWDTEVREALSELDLVAPDSTLDDPPAATRVLAMLPHLYALGVNRVRQELSRKGIPTGPDEADGHSGGSEPGSNGSSAAEADADGEPGPSGPDGGGAAPDLFPLVGFSPVSGSDETLSVRTLRTNVAVIGNAMITIRLPDLACPDERRRPGEPNGPLQPSDRATPEDLYVPGRYFPCWDAGADDLAEEIARHQASTSRALSDEVRESMHSCAEAVASAGRPDRRGWKEREDEEEQKQLVFQRLSQVTDMADRQLARLLRRLGSYGETDEAAKDSRAVDMRRRYRYALDEIRSLERELASVRDRHRAHMDAQSQIDRSRFEDMVALAGAAILLPALVVGIFSANVWLPGREDTHRFAALLLMILGCALGAALTIDRIRARKLPQTRPQLGAAGLVALSFLVAVVLLVK
jgi:CorA-like Mg2+ transporter protein